MISEAPEFWWKKRSFFYYLLLPFSWIYSKFSLKAFEKTSIKKINIPVICLGNYTLGGCGKTPLSIAIAQSAIKNGYKPGFITRGYGGTVKHLHFVDAKNDCARLVGDEPLLLADVAPTVVGVNRYEAAKTLEEYGCNLIIMDDGFQSRRLHFDYALLLVDALRGFGNGAVFPAGPLRAPLKTQLAYTSSIILIGEGEKSEEILRVAARAGREISHINFCSKASENVEGKHVLAFSAIANPDKFYNSIQNLGAHIEDKRAYPDHHFFTVYNIKDLSDTADRRRLTLVTTKKDYKRLSKDFILKQNLGVDDFKNFLKRLIVFDVHYNNDEFCMNLVEQTEKNFLCRSL